MRFVRMICDASPGGCYGLVRGDTVTLLEGSPLEGVRETRREIPLRAVRRYLPPVDPPNIIAIGRNYLEHARESNTDAPPRPLIFIKTTNSVTAHGQPVILPAEAPDEVDYEVELAVVIGERTRNVLEADALKHVFGYTIGQDISARDCQLRLDQQWARGKSFDTFCPIGPWIETDLDPGKTVLRTVLNGTVMQEDSTENMIFPVAFLISYLSRMMTLLPGTVVMTGTPSGVGFARKPPVFLRDGDTLVSEIDGIGRMENPVEREAGS